ncbi:MAG: hypothetical protein WBP59_16410 [Ilumatobacteraceae bacterium]
MTVHTTSGWRRVRIAGLAAVALVGFAACGSDDGSPTTDPPPTSSDPPDDSTSPGTDATLPPGETTVPDAGPDGTAALGPTAQGMVDVAVLDLADRFDLAPDDITVVTVEEVTWRDASLGCPQKDMQYLQVLTPGTRLVLTDGERTFDFHAGADRGPFYCARPEPPAPD